MESDISNRLRQLLQQQSGLPFECSRARGSVLVANSRSYIDFYSGGGRLNYGHQNSALMQRLTDDLRAHGGLSAARQDQICNSFLTTVQEVLLKPRLWFYHMQFASVTGASALEIALHFARKVKGRQNIISFTQGFEGASGRALAEAARRCFHRVAGNPWLGNVTFMPYDRCFGPDVDTIAYLEQLLDSTGRSDDRPAAVVVETVLGQGGVNVLTWHWLKELEALCQRRDMLLILDDTQVGCGRTGRFFSFEAADIHADIIVLSKSLSGFGLPASLVLTDPALGPVSVCAPHNGASLLDQQLALLSATHALQEYWQDDDFSAQIASKEGLVRDWLENIVHSYPDYGLGVRGRGLIQGLVASSNSDLAGAVAREALEHGLLIEASGSNDEVLKLLPALTIDEELLIKGLEIIERSLAKVLTQGVVKLRGPRSNKGGGQS